MAPGGVQSVFKFYFIDSGETVNQSITDHMPLFKKQANTPVTWDIVTHLKWKKCYAVYLNNRMLSWVIHSGYEGSEIAGKIHKM